MPLSNPSTSSLPLDLADIPWSAAFEAKRLAPLSDGAPLSTWPDFSGHGCDAAQTGSARPSYKTAANGINGQPVVRFTAASSQYLKTTTGAAALSGDCYMAAIVRFTALTGFQQILCFGNDLSGQRRALLKYDAGSAHRPGWNGQSADITPGGPSPTAGVACLLEVARISGVISVYLNGVRTSTGSPSLTAYSSAALRLGTNNGEASEFLDGDLALVLFLGSAPSDTVLQRVRGYARAVYGISTHLGAAGFLAGQTASGLPSQSSFYDNGTEAGVIGPRFVAQFAGSGPGHLFVNNDPANGPVIFQNLNPIGYGAVDFWGETSGLYSGGSVISPFGCAVGWGNSAATPAVFRGVGYFECYDSDLGGSHRGFRLIQTAQGHNYCRFEVEAATGDIVFRRRDNDYPSETEILRLKESGAIVIASLPTSDPAIAGQLWNSSGTVKISAG